MTEDWRIYGIEVGDPLTIERDEWGESGTDMQLVKTDASWTLHDLYEHFHHSCGCTYDCCGHTFGSVYDVQAVRTYNPTHMSYCHECNGTGALPHGPCRRCNGKGEHLDIGEGDTIGELPEDTRLWVVWTTWARNV